MQSDRRWRGGKSKAGIESLITIAAVLLISVFFGEGSVSERAGIVVGSLIVFVACFGPVIYVQHKDIKVKRPKPYFVEPRMLIAVPLYLVLSAVTFLILIVITNIGEVGESVQRELESDSLFGNTYVSILIFSSILVPVAIYMIIISTRYRRIIEYGTKEWHKMHSLKIRKTGNEGFSREDRKGKSNKDMEKS